MCVLVNKEDYALSSTHTYLSESLSKGAMMVSTSVVGHRNIHTMHTTE